MFIYPNASVWHMLTHYWTTDQHVSAVSM